MRSNVIDADILSSLPSIIKALGDNPIGTVALVCLAALAVAAYAISKSK